MFIQFYEKVDEKSILEYSVEENSRFKYKKKIKLPKEYTNSSLKSMMLEIKHMI